MRMASPGVLAATAIAIMVAAPLPAAALELPQRKPGLWDLKVEAEGGAMPVTSVQQCVDAESDAQLQAMGTAMTAQMCPGQQMTRDGDTITVTSACTIDGREVRVNSIITGDFQSAYTMKVAFEGDGLQPGTPRNMTVTSTWTGACKAGQKPGDVIMGSLIMNVREMRRMMEGAKDTLKGGAKK
ncbi:MAG TPA: DUF3617 family protein [Xanthobacteraceae bacterium]|nr:DUF3617 family protein [Xanthobacteraceae bacterium]